MGRFNKKILLAVLFFLAFSERVFLDLGPNMELMTVTMLIASAYLGTKHSVFLVLSVLFLSDLIIGNTNIFLFTWSGFIIPAIVLANPLKRAKIKVYAGTLFGMGTSLFFYLWTNFGVWLLDTWGMYANDTSGLAMAYINGLPFLKASLVSTILFVPIGFAAFEAYLNRHLLFQVYLSKRSLSLRHQN